MKAGQDRDRDDHRGRRRAARGASDDVLAHLWIGNGFTQAEAFSTYDEKRAELLTVNAQLPPFLAGIKRRQGRLPDRRHRLGGGGVRPGRQRPARHRQQGLRPGHRRPGLEGARQARGRRGRRTPTGCRPAEFKKGVITGFDFEGVPEPTDELRRVHAVQGRRAAGREGQTHRGALPRPGLRRREALRRELRAARARRRRSAIGTGQVIKGWDQALVGVPVGSRMVIEVPPDLGYGEEGNPDAGIKDATLVLRHRRPRPTA